MDIVTLLLIFLFTPLRATLFLLIPFFIPLLYKALKMRVDLLFYIITFIIAASFIATDFNVTPIANSILSICIIIPLILLWLSDLQYRNYKYTKLFFSRAQKILRYVDLLCILAYIFFNRGDDTLDIVYGKHFESIHGLAIINLLFSLYLICTSYTKHKTIKENLKSKNIKDAILFFIIFFLCFYGLSVVCLFLSIITFFICFNFNFKKIIFLTFILSGIGIIYNFAFNDNSKYIINNIQKAFVNPNDARKMLMYYEATDLINTNPSKFILGIGPGGYNSRIGFMLNPDAHNILTKSFGFQKPKYHMKYIYPLWNSKFVSMDSFTDGTRNKPFSSIVSFFIEYGIIFTLLFIYSFIILIKRGLKHKSTIKGKLLIFIYIYTFYLLILDRWFESTEFVLIALFLMFLRKELKENQKITLINIIK